MWRPFLGNLTDKTYDTYQKRQSRLNTAPSKPQNPQNPPNSLIYPRSLSLDTTLRLQEYKALQEKVRNQRRSIKQFENQRQIKNQAKFTEFKIIKEEEKQKKFEELEKIRTFSNHKAKKPQPLNILPKQSIDEFYNKDFFETRFRPKTVKKGKSYKITYKIPKKKNQESLRQAQDRLIKELKVTAPNFYKDTKMEFMKIRKQCEMTFEQYIESRRLKSSNPYNIRKKKKSM